MLKRIVAILLCIAISFITLFYDDTKVSADELTVYYFASERDLSSYTISDFNTTYDNYLVNYDIVSGDIKTDVYSDQTYDAWLGSNFNNTLFADSNTTGQDILSRFIYSIQNDYSPSANLNYKALEVAPVVISGQIADQTKVKYIICWQQNNNNYNWNLNIYSVYIPDGTTAFLEQGRLMCTSNNVYISGVSYNYQTPVNEDYLTFSKYQDITSTNQYYTTYDWNLDNQPDLYQYYINLNSWFYSDLPVLYMYENNSNGTGSYLNQTPYFYGDYNGRGGSGNSVAKYYINGGDSTGFITDRRSAKMQNVEQNNNNEIVQSGFDPKLFNGTLGFNSFVANGSLNYNSTTEQYEPYFDIIYQPNNYTEINIEDITLYWQAEVSLKLTLTKNFNNNYSMSTRYKTSGSGSLDRSLTAPNASKYEFKLYAMQNPPLGNSTWNNTSTRNTAGLDSQFGVTGFSGSSVDYDITLGVSAYKHNSYVIVDSETDKIEMIQDYIAGKTGSTQYNSYGLYQISLYVKNNITGDVSQTYSAVFDLYGNKLTDNANQMINNDDSAYNDFINDFYYVDDNGDLVPVNYADRYNLPDNYNTNNVYVNSQYPYILVDIPENEWLNKTPNLKNMLTDFKTMLAETQEGSILTMLPATYSYLPAPVWNYILYGVGICVMIGIWHAITRR